MGLALPSVPVQGLMVEKRDREEGTLSATPTQWCEHELGPIRSHPYMGKTYNVYSKKAFMQVGEGAKKLSSIFSCSEWLCVETQAHSRNHGEYTL